MVSRMQELARSVPGVHVVAVPLMREVRAGLRLPAYVKDWHTYGALPFCRSRLRRQS
jgi:hypothetical protein